jgi:hypothetical protein
MEKASQSAPARRDEGLDDVLMAMDVVDTLRHREQIFRREMDSEGREEELVARLKEIYASQGMDVPDRVIRDGVDAMADRRFSHQPAKAGLRRRLAIIYVTRARWLKPVAVAAAGLGVFALIWQFGVVAPREARQEALRVEMQQTLPDELSAAAGAARDVATSQAARARIVAIEQAGRVALEQGERAGVQAAIGDLRQLRGDLSAVYDVRIVSRPGERSGVYRIPDNAPRARNYYLVVEAIDGRGQAITVPVVSEETQTVHRVSRWAQRVSRAVYDRVAADKADDQIIQDSVIARKQAGQLEPEYDVATPGGAIVEW